MNRIDRRGFGSALVGLIAGGMAPAPRAMARADRPVLRMRIGSSLFSGIKRCQAVTIVKPVAALVAERAECDLDFAIHTVAREGDLDALGRALVRGEYHMAGIWGLEFGWLRRQFPELQLLVSSRYRIDSNQSLVYARKGAFADIGDLRGKVIAQYAKFSLMEELYTGELLRSRSFDPAHFFRPSPEVYANAKAAIKAIAAGKADCGVVDAITYLNLTEEAPGLIKHLEVVARTEDYPPRAIIGNPARFEEMRRGLWQTVGAATIGLGTDAQGQELIHKWQVEGFDPPGTANLARIEAAVKRFPRPVYDRRILPPHPVTA